MQIPIENIYYLLCYSWDKLEEKDRVDIAVEDTTSLQDLFAKVLINGTRNLLKRGIDKSYVNYTDEIAGVKGKIEFSTTIKRNLLLKQRTICSFDDFSADVLINRILFTTIAILSKTKGLDKQLRNDLIGVARMLPGITMIPLSKELFGQVRLNRNNNFYGFLMNVCQIIYESLLPTETPGVYRFSDFTRDEKKMNQLFEAFIRNFYRREQNHFPHVGREKIKWQFQETTGDMHQYVPGMETDITLENVSEKIIIDAKYYKETMTVHYDRQRIKSNNLYQLFSYLLNQENNTEKTINAKGILLYPTIDAEYDLEYKYKSHDICIITINLNTNWKKIHTRLLDILHVNRKILI